MIKLIALDIDGTLLGKKKKVSKRNIAAINAAREAGVKICIATGRSNARVEDIAKAIGITKNQEHLICLNGGGIYKYDENEKLQTVKETLFSIDEVKFIYNTALDENINCFSYSEDTKTAYVIKNKGPFVWFMKKITKKKIEIYKRDEMDQRAFKVITYGNKENIAKARKAFETKKFEMFSWSYVSNKTVNIEINPPGVDKLFALQEVASLYNIKPEEVMYFGDGDNDKRAIAWAGHGVAMKNAAKHVKEAAKHTTDHHKKSGVGKKIEELVLKK
ncbi:HAD superfamily hydrolase [Spiroplasma chinense]|uniref:HAD superfamily hydrolase n=1 Tax=Spiroplasma chinense TaxID=216932 RepID=A0A5B9Y5U3_9MOLU|nr:HAD family hydrolase [Spiroplasma chinense]QEH61392.1 HAD superfamily hydrolase [Spiroplasma chinense]